VDSAGRVVVLNGTSSSGKSTLANAFRDEQAGLGRCWIIWGIDEFFPKLHEQWHAIGDMWVGAHSATGPRIVETPEGVRFLLGDTMRRLLGVYRDVVATTARAGFDVIVDEVVIDESCWTGWTEALAGLDVTWIGVHCDEAVLEAREQARGDRYPGLARSQMRTVHLFPTYALELDTSTRPVAEAVADLSAFLAAR